jgi:selenocysteine-specific elongation factor
MIVATAGHVDHGKTLLLKALTGVDTDRLPEEKRRGMTIDLGFAYLPILEGETIGFVDVPGHERFIHNMLCGIAGIDFVLLVVAADDGVMPQTREHLAILDLLGVSSGAVAITKTDRVTPAQLDEVAAEITRLLSGTSLATAPLFPVSATTGAGIADLKSHLVRAARTSPVKATSGNFRLSVDRCFNVVGAGVVVTGTAVSGSVSIGEQVRTLSAGLPARVRGIHAQSSPSQSGRAGQRCALNLAGPDINQHAILRGDWVVTGEVAPAARKLDTNLRVLNSEKHSLTNWTAVHVHLGAEHVTGRLAVLESSEIAAGDAGLVQLVLDRPIGAVHGDQFIVRDQSARRTIGGGSVIDVFPPARGRSKPVRLAFLRAMSASDDLEALAALIENAAHGLDLTRFAASRNLTLDESHRVFAQVPMRIVPTETHKLGFSPQHWEQLKGMALKLLTAWHRRAPDAIGPSIDRVFAGSDVRLPRAISAAVVAELAREGAVVRQGTAVRLPDHQPMLNAADSALWKKVVPLIDQSGLRPPTIAEIASAVGADQRRIESLLVRASRLGMLTRVSQNRFFRPDSLRQLAEAADRLAAENAAGLLTVVAFRDYTAIGRNLTIEVLEFFDRVRFTQRIGEARKIIGSAHDAFAGPSR